VAVEQFLLTADGSVSTNKMVTGLTTRAVRVGRSLEEGATCSSCERLRGEEELSMALTVACVHVSLKLAASRITLELNKGLKTTVNGDTVMQMTVKCTTTLIQSNPRLDETGISSIIQNIQRRN